MSEQVEELREAARLMREQHGPEHERHAMWAAMADWLDFIAGARVTIDGIAAARSRNGAGWLVPEDTASRVFRDMEGHALTVARAYPAAVAAVPADTTR